MNRAEKNNPSGVAALAAIAVLALLASTVPAEQPAKAWADVREATFAQVREAGLDFDESTLARRLLENEREAVRRELGEAGVAGRVRLAPEARALRVEPGDVFGDGPRLAQFLAKRKMPAWFAPANVSAIENDNGGRVSWEAPPAASLGLREGWAGSLPASEARKAVAASLLQFRMLHPDHDRLAGSDGQLVEGVEEQLAGPLNVQWEALPGRNLAGEEAVFVTDRNAPLTGADVVSATAMDASRGGEEKGLLIAFDKGGTAALADLTRQNVGGRLAIIAGGRVVAAPMIMTPILGGECMVAGSFSPQEAEAFARLLSLGAPETSEESGGASGGKP